MEARCRGPAQRGSLPDRHDRPLSPACQRFLDSGEVVERACLLRPCGDHVVGLSRRQGLDPELGFPSLAETRDLRGGRCVVCLQARKTWCIERHAPVRAVKKNAWTTKEVVRDECRMFQIAADNGAYCQRTGQRPISAVTGNLPTTAAAPSKCLVFPASVPLQETLTV